MLVKRGGWSNFRGIFLMNFELLTFPYYKEMIKLTICHVSKMNPFPYRKLLYRSIKFYTCSSKTSQMHFLHYAFFKQKVIVSVPFSWPFFWQN